MFTYNFIISIGYERLEQIKIIFYLIFIESNLCSFNIHCTLQYYLFSRISSPHLDIAKKKMKGGANSIS